MCKEEDIETILKKVFSSALVWKPPTLVDGECPQSDAIFKAFLRIREEALNLARIQLSKAVELDTKAILRRMNDFISPLGSKEQILLDRIKKSAECLDWPHWYAGGFETVEHRADFEHWCRMKWWDLHQATALSIGFEPRGEIVFDKVGVKVYYPARRFYEKRHALIRNNFQTREGCFIQPIQFCMWAVSAKLPVPVDLLQAANTILETDFHISKPKAERSIKLENRERVALLKMVIGMAIKGYSFDPNATRSRTPQEICDDLALLGLPLDVKTVRKYLAEGTQLIPDNVDRE